MEVSATSVAASLATFARTERAPDIAETKGDVREHDSPRHSHHGIRGRGLALHILRQELKFALSAGFRNAIPGFAASDTGTSASEVAEEALSAVKQLLTLSSTDASRTVLALKKKISQAAASTQKLTHADDDFGEVKDAIKLVNAGISQLESQAQNTFESSASVLKVETKLTQKSTIRIRTQEGDVVRLSLRRKESLSATDVAISNANGSATSTEVEISSKSRLKLVVKGDLNEAEMAAVLNIFAQAEAIAHEFFGGDLAAAFDLASGLEYDTEQLARVSLRFREKQVSNLSFAAIGHTGANPVDDTEPVPVVTTNVAPPTSNEPSSNSEIAPVVVTEPATDDVLPDTKPGPPVVGDTALNGFLDLISNFLRATSARFGEDFGNHTIKTRFFYSASFKLEILKTVLELSAPAKSEDGASHAATIIDAVSVDNEQDSHS